MDHPHQFQLFDLLPDSEYSALKADIARRGVLVPIELDQHGSVLDGHHRLRACHELGVKNYPTVVRRFNTDDEREEHIVTLNVRRRHLNGEQKRKWAEWFLRRHPDWTDRRIAGEIGVSHPTVADVRSGLESAGELEKFTSRIGKNGVAKPASQPKPMPPPSIFTMSRNSERAQSAAAELDRPGTFDLNRAERIAREQVAERRRAEPTEQRTTDGSIDLRHGDFREVLADLSNVDAIITDPPYPQEYLPLFADLSELAARILAPHGSLVAMVGQWSLRDYLRELDTHLAYRWCAAYIAHGARTRVHAAKVGTGWKPLLVYTRRDADAVPFLVDDLFTAANAAASKRFHHWGQSEAGIAEQVERFTKPGDLVVDPFLGGGTTAVVCKALGRRFIGCDLDAAAVQVSRERIA